MENQPSYRPVSDEEESDIKGVSPWYEGLSDKQRRFVEEYCHDWNKTQAAIRAGYSENTDSAAVIGHRLLRNVKISSALDSYLNAVSMSSAEAIHKLTQWGRGTLEPFIQDGNIDLESEAALSNFHLLKEFEQTKTIVKGKDSTVETIRSKIKIHDPMSAAKTILELRGKIIRKHELTGKDGGPIEHKHELSDLSDEELNAILGNEK